MPREAECNMRPTDILSSEHRVIEQVLDCLEALANQSQSEGRIDRARAEQVLEVLRTFADRCHHGKEEDRLFPVLIERGMPKHAGPVAVMLDEHRSGREYIRRMGEANAAGETAVFVRAANSYVELMRDHIATEDGVLFPMAESMLDDSARKRLLESFRTFEHDDLGAGTHERMLAIANELAAHYGIPLASTRAPAATGHGHCGHQRA